MKRIFGLSVAVAGLLVSSAGSAATVPLSIVVDLNGPGRNLSQDELIFTAAKLATPVKITDGDLLQFTITFAGDESISVTGPGASFKTSFKFASTTDVPGNTNTPVASTGTIKLLGPDLTSQQVTTNSSASATDFVTAAKFSNLPNPVTITGLYWETTVDFTSFAGSSAFRMFDTPSFQIDGTNVAVSGSVPEPATWAMMVIGFGAVGAGLRGRRSSSVKFA